MAKIELMEEKPGKKIELNDLGVWLKIAVIGWFAYLGLTIISIIATVISMLSGNAGV